MLKNEYAQGAMGELSVFDAWPELWVVEDRDYDAAVAIIDSALSESDASGWTCPRCRESNGPAFESCWKCGAARNSG